MGVHHNTPTLSANDPRGLSIRTVDYWRDDGVSATQSRIRRTLRDVVGRSVVQWDPRLWALQMSDPLTPANLTMVYSLNSQVLRSDSVDAGTRVAFYGLGAQVLLDWDSLGTRREVEYDVLLRPVAVFEEGVATPRRCVERYRYGQLGAGDASKNQLGQLIRHDDPAGSVLFETFAITGQCSENIRHFTLDPASPDWPERIEDRARLLEPGEGATSRWRFGPLAQVLEQVDARDNRQGVELTVDGRLRAARLQLKLQPDNRPTVSDIRYNADGQVEHELAGNGVRSSLTYQPQSGRLISRRTTDASGNLLQHLVYTYDRMGNVLSIEDAAQPIRYFANQRIDPISRFTYDSLYQLSEASGREAGASNQGPTSVSRADPAAFSNYRQTCRYDAGGNLLELTHVGAQAQGRQFKTARYSNRGLPWRNGVPPTEAQIAAAYDARGNLLELDQGRFAQWDLRNQLHLVSPVERASESDDQETYLYAAGGQRVRKIRALQTNARTVLNEVRYLPGLELRIDSAGEVLQVVSVQTGLNSVHVMHWEEPPPSGNDSYRYHFSDHLGSTSLELGADARIISQETYYPFGETAWSSESEVGYRTVRYSGKERDATGLYYYGYRYYIPRLQRWMNPDPAGAIDGLNLYRMVRNNPMNLTDPSGLNAKDRRGIVARMSSVFSQNSQPQTSLPARPPIPPKPVALRAGFAAAPKLPRRPFSPPVPAAVPVIAQPFQPASTPVVWPSNSGAAGPLPSYAAGSMTIGMHTLLVGQNKGVVVMRGDDRAPEQIRAAGGFFPRDNRGAQIKEEFRQAAISKGINTLANEHVRSPVPGFISTGMDEDSGGYGDTRNYLYRMEIPGLQEREVNQQTLGLATPPKSIPKGRLGTRILMSDDTLNNSGFVAMIPPMTVEMTFITPIPNEYIIAFRSARSHQWQLFH
ncbi:RHS repeat domain-containing protein [Pseudomonas sp. RIT288]|uniref:RHS repeat domain-containing protein n=1 Tax=Pseudomonas sp. RIT288 TaxID=1470589 RepID=UPI00044CA1FF|nr:RHS repeat-associated core domain-containing protein [Pseudomonas sp. RIT288]EZP27411.1 insecticidal toxin protein [Pseudomonas sp. RIT288]